MFLSLEEETGCAGFVSPEGNPCSPGIGPENILQRLEKIQNTEESFNFKFKGIHLRGYSPEMCQDLTEENRTAIGELIEHFREL